MAYCAAWCAPVRCTGQLPDARVSCPLASKSEQAQQASASAGLVWKWQYVIDENVVKIDLLVYIYTAGRQAAPYVLLI